MVIVYNDCKTIARGPRLARLKGVRNPGYNAKRRELLERLRDRLGRSGAMRASSRELAAAAGISLSTLTHYFGSRDGVVMSVMAEDRDRGAEHAAILATPSDSFQQSIRDAVMHMAAGFRFGGVSEIHALGLAEGLRHAALGPGFIDLILEPAIAALSKRLQTHMDRGEMRIADPRTAALILVSPVLVAFLHQNELGGASVYPLDLDRFLDEHIESFFRGFEIGNTRRAREKEPAADRF